MNGMAAYFCTKSWFAKGQVMPNKTIWSERGVEPALAEMTSDPLVQLVMARDGLTKEDFWQAVFVARARLGQRTADRPYMDSAA